MPSPSVSFRAGSGFGFSTGPDHSMLATVRHTGAPKPRVSPGPPPRENFHCSVGLQCTPKSPSTGVDLTLNRASLSDTTVEV